MSKKPANLVYGVDERPPLDICLILAVQHILIFAGGLIMATIVMKALGGSPELTQSVLSMSIIAGGLGTMLQALKRGPVGSGFLCTEIVDPTFISISIMAGAVGGISLILGMTVFSGLVECALSQAVKRLRVLFPPEVTGTILAMVGLSLIKLMVLNFFGLSDARAPIDNANLAVGLITFFALAGTNIWCKGRLKLSSIIVGMGIGYLAAWLLGIFGEQDINRMAEFPLFSFPDISYIGWSFDLVTAVPVFIATLATTLKSVGTLTMCQKVNDAEWKRPDLDNIGAGILADGVTTVLGGMIGALRQSLIASSVGLSVATGVTSRVVAFFVGGIFIVLAFFPKIIALFTLMPKPIMGGTLVFMISFMIVSGIQIATSRMIDTRKTLLIAVSFIFGLSVDFYPELYRNMHPWVRPLFSSSLTMATVLAVALNAVFRIGIKRRVSIDLEPGVDSSDKIFQFMENCGAAWGARKEVMHQATSALSELIEVIANYKRLDRFVTVQVSFDEYNLEVHASYSGEMAEMPTQRPSEAELMDDPQAWSRLSGYLIRNYADRVSTSQDGHLCRIDLHFEH